MIEYEDLDMQPATCTKIDSNETDNITFGISDDCM